jgi:hypothetical protein
MVDIDVTMAHFYLVVVDVRLTITKCMVPMKFNTSKEHKSNGGIVCDNCYRHVRMEV